MENRMVNLLFVLSLVEARELGFESLTCVGVKWSVCANFSANFDTKESCLFRGKIAKSLAEQALEWPAIWEEILAEIWFNKVETRCHFHLSLPWVKLAKIDHAISYMWLHACTTFHFSHLLTFPLVSLNKNRPCLGLVKFCFVFLSFNIHHWSKVVIFILIHWIFHHTYPHVKLSLVTYHPKFGHWFA